MTADLVALLKRQVTARAFPIFHIATAAVRVPSKPDFEVADGGVHIGSAKFGASKEFLAFKTAQEYAVTIPITREMRGRHLGEVFSVTYPSTCAEKYSLHILTRADKHDE